MGVTTTNTDLFCIGEKRKEDVERYSHLGNIISTNGATEKIVLSRTNSAYFWSFKEYMEFCSVRKIH